MTRGTRGRNGPDGNSSTVKQTIVETLEAPRLNGISTQDFVKFKQDREIYERRAAEKNSQDGVTVALTSHRNSIENPILALVLRAEWVAASDTDSITEDQIRSCIQMRSRIDPADYNLAQIEKGIQHVRLRNRQKSLEMKVWELGLQYATVLENLGYTDFIQKQPYLAVKHILKRITDEQLKKRISLIYKLLKEELKGNDAKLVRGIAKEARGIVKHEAAPSFQPSHEEWQQHSESDEEKCLTTKRISRRGNKRKRVENGGSNINETSKSTKRQGPACLNPNCNEKHHISVRENYCSRT